MLESCFQTFGFHKNWSIPAAVCKKWIIFHTSSSTLQMILGHAYWYLKGGSIKTCSELWVTKNSEECARGPQERGRRRKKERRGCRNTENEMWSKIELIVTEGYLKTTKRCITEINSVTVNSTFPYFYSHWWGYKGCRLVLRLGGKMITWHKLHPSKIIIIEQNILCIEFELAFYTPVPQT